MQSNIEIHIVRPISRRIRKLSTTCWLVAFDPFWNLVLNLALMEKY